MLIHSCLAIESGDSIGGGEHPVYALTDEDILPAFDLNKTTVEFNTDAPVSFFFIPPTTPRPTRTRTTPSPATNAPIREPTLISTHSLAQVPKLEPSFFLQLQSIPIEQVCQKP